MDSTTTTSTITFTASSSSTSGGGSSTSHGNTRKPPPITKSSQKNRKANNNYNSGSAACGVINEDDDQIFSSSCNPQASLSSSSINSIMMKRVRALDGRNFRRIKKSKFGENVYFNTSTFSYLKLLSIWVSCIAFDLLLGCRLELAWPIVLFVRHFNEIMNAPNGPLRFYSAFSIFYLLLTITSDLICYLFLPVQILLFVSSVHIWLQFSFTCMDRGLSPSVLILWGVFLFFEYFFRYKMSSPQWYESRSVMVTASLFPAMTDAFLANQMSSTRLTLYRLFASHALGFPIVTLSFRLKTVISNWLYERCRSDVQKKNEIFDRILTEALPAVYEGKKRHELNRRPQQFAIEGDALDFELDPTGSDLLDEPRLCLSSNGPVPSIFDKLPTNSPIQGSRTVDSGVPFSRKTSKAKISMTYKQQNGTSNSSNQLNTSGKASKKLSRNGKPSSDVLDDLSGEGTTLADDEYPSGTSTSALTYLISLLHRFFVNWLLSTFSLLQSIGDIIILRKPTTSVAANRDGNEIGIGKEQDDMISTSGDGSQRPDEDSDGESVATSIMDIPTTSNGQLGKGYNNNNGKKKGKQQPQHLLQARVNPRGRTPTIDGEFEVPIMANGKNKKGKQQVEEKREDEIDKLRIDLRGAKLVESELREQISALSQVEKQCKNEVQQYKLRYDQLDLKYKTLTKQQDQQKTTIASMERRILDAQSRKDQLEKELAIERGGIKVEKPGNGNEDGKANDIIESLKAKINKLEADVRKSRSDVKSKDEFTARLEAKFKQVEIEKTQAKDMNTRLQSEVIQLKKALTEENRIKQDLFKALKTSKAEVDLLKARLNDDGDTGRSNSSPSNNGDPITEPPSPSVFGPSKTSTNLDDFLNYTNTNYFAYGRLPSSNGILSSASELRESPIQHSIPLDPAHLQAMTSATRSS